MEKVQILVYALASFFCVEYPPILAKSATIEIDMNTQQVVLQQYDIVTIPDFKTKAFASFQDMLKASSFVKDLEPLVLTNQHFYEEDEQLNASINFHFEDVKDLRAISMYFDAEKNTLSYPFMEEFKYTAPDAILDERYLHFKVDKNIKFGMSLKPSPELDSTLSLLPEWKRIVAGN